MESLPPKPKNQSETKSPPPERQTTKREIEEAKALLAQMFIVKPKGEKQKLPPTERESQEKKPEPLTEPVTEARPPLREQPMTEKEIAEAKALLAGMTNPYVVKKEVSNPLLPRAERERQELLMEIVLAARGQTRIHTDLPTRDEELRYAEGSQKPDGGGFNSFGDGLQKEVHSFDTFLYHRASPEAFIFEPDMKTLYKTVVKAVTKKGLLWNKTEQVADEVAYDEVANMIKNHTTGKEEPALKVAYQFSSGDLNYQGPEYRVNDGRRGNILLVEVTLPKSMAEKLRQKLTSDPQIARDFAKTLVLNNGISDASWKRVVRPPYDRLPQDWKLAIVDLQARKDNKKIHTTVSEQFVQIGK